ncbi:CBO0543 family protein [Alkalibacillus aidingensis]|uniref:CBO0543 family protein n=1 Tax=Alkalibacillus aidingensis TaxID=2747607 RepID=UPI0016615698|nr:CBO0543 family protein [Alkalibacillus aidingensis]
MKQKHVALIVVIIVVNLMKKTWRDIPKYYKSMIYVSSVNALYYYICNRHLIWEFTPFGISWRLLRGLHILVVTPLLVLAFLSKYPEMFSKRLIHLFRWVFGVTIVEHLAHKQKLIQYKHGWNIFWSGIVYLQMFLYSHLFNRRPIMTLFMSFFTIILFVAKFKVPLRTNHPFSRRFSRSVDFFYHSILEDVF